MCGLVWLCKGYVYVSYMPQLVLLRDVVVGCVLFVLFVVLGGFDCCLR